MRPILRSTMTCVETISDMNGEPDGRFMVQYFKIIMRLIRFYTPQLESLTLCTDLMKEEERYPGASGDRPYRMEGGRKAVGEKLYDVLRGYERLLKGNEYALLGGFDEGSVCVCV